MRRFSWRELSPNYSKYGEHYSILDKIITWLCLAVLIIAGIGVATTGQDFKTKFVATGAAYIALWSMTTIYSKCLKHRIKELYPLSGKMEVKK